jgi:hypothetical protein
MAKLYDLLKKAGLNIKENHYSKPSLPYGVFIDDISTSGPDSKPGMIVDHGITVLWASEYVDTDNEAKIESCINAAGLNFARTRDWLDTEKMYQTTYDISLKAKKG